MLGTVVGVERGRKRRWLRGNTTLPNGRVSDFSRPEVICCGGWAGGARHIFRKRSRLVARVAVLQTARGWGDSYRGRRCAWLGATLRSAPGYNVSALQAEEGC